MKIQNFFSSIFRFFENFDVSLLRVKICDKLVLHSQIGQKIQNNRTNLIEQNFYAPIIGNINIAPSVIEALNSGNKNAIDVQSGVDEALQKGIITVDKILSVLKRPKYLATLADANKIVYSTSDIDMKKVLSKLVVELISSDVDDDTQAISLAIKMMESLTINQIKAIAFLKLVRSNYLKEKISYSEFKGFYNNILSKLIDFPEKLRSGISTSIFACGAVVSRGYAGEIYPYLCKGLQKENGMFHNKVNPEERVMVEHLNVVYSYLAFGNALLTPQGHLIGEIYLKDILGLKFD